jgi:hypothetical protein
MPSKVIHRFSTGYKSYPQVFHRVSKLSTGFPQSYPQENLRRTYVVKYTHPCVPKATLSVSTVVNYTHLGCGKIYTGRA